MRPFFDLPDTDWDQLTGKLHLYITAPPTVRELAAHYHEVMRPHSDLVSLQPPEWLHLTIQMLQVHAGSPAAIDAMMGDDSLQNQLRAELAGFEPFDLTVGPAVVGVHGVTLWSPPPAAAFIELVGRCRTAVGKAFGEQVLAGPPKQPHVTIGYGRATGDSDGLIRSVKDVWAEPVTFTVDAVDLVAVTQDPIQGRFTWNQIHHIELPPARKATASVLWNNTPPEEERRRATEISAPEEAEEAAAGIRRLALTHGLGPGKRDELAALKDFVTTICDQHGIVPGASEMDRHRYPASTTWRFGPPTATADLAVVRAALTQRHPDWPIDADDQ